MNYRFECTQCGKCCRCKPGEPHFVWLTADDKTRIGARLGLPPWVIDGMIVDQHNGREHIAFRPAGGELRCPFLDGDLCRIYEDRPMQCRTFPWQPEYLTPDGWEQAKRRCEGIGRGDVVPLDVVRRTAGEFVAGLVFGRNRK